VSGHKDFLKTDIGGVRTIGKGVDWTNPRNYRIPTLKKKLTLNAQERLKGKPNFQMENGSKKLTGKGEQRGGGVQKEGAPAGIKTPQTPQLDSGGVRVTNKRFFDEGDTLNQGNGRLKEEGRSKENQQLQG